MQQKKVLIAAGGTGGHIFPALAVADILKEKGCDIAWLGSRIGLEQQIVATHYPIFYISIDRVRGKGIIKKLISPILMTIAMLQSCRIILKHKPGVILVMGGFASGPAGIAAWLLRKPMVVHESNAIAGYTNTILAKLANKILCGFPDAFSKKCRVENVGNPVRKLITAIPTPDVRLMHRDNDLRVLILGGSQGASAINYLLINALKKSSFNNRLDIWHQTGKKDYADIGRLYADMPVKAKVSEFIDDMVAAYSWAEIVICRSGALTVSELAAVGLASILIPFPYAVDNHQYYNAKYLQDAGAAYLFLQQDISPEKLNELLQKFINQAELYKAMALKARALARPDAADKVAKICLQYFCSNEKEEMKHAT